MLFSSCPQFSLSSESFPMSQLFTSDSQSFHFSSSPSNEYSGLISFGIDWFDVLAVQGTLRNLLPHHNSKASILRPSTFFMVQLSHLYMTTGKTIAVTTWTFVSKKNHMEWLKELFSRTQAPVPDSILERFQVRTFISMSLSFPAWKWDRCRLTCFPNLKDDNIGYVLRL